MNTNTPFPGAAPDFSDPLGLLRACHERILQHCDRLVALSRHLKEKGADSEAKQAAATIHRYFSTAARHHHADEEEDLFPRLCRQSQELADTVDRLEGEHRQLDTLWQELAPLLAEPETIDDPTAFDELAQDLSQAYRSHVSTENTQILDAAQGLIDADELAQIGHNMAKRRGVTPPASLSTN